MQHNKSFRPGRWPFRQRSRRVGADAAFAKAIARSEFGRFYTDDQEQREGRRSLDRAEARRKPKAPSPEPAKQEEVAPTPSKSKRALWHQPSPRLRRTELAEARARL